MAGHSHQSHEHGSDTDWASRAADITREGEVLMPYFTETVTWIASLCRGEGWEVRRIADIGSGPGVGTCVLAQEFDSAVVIAVDGSREMLDRAEARVKALGLSMRVQTLQAEIPVGLDRVGQVDLVWAAMVLHHIGDPVAALRELRSLLKPGGMLIVAEFGDPSRFLPDDVSVGRPGLGERLGDVDLSAAGFSDVSPDVIRAAGFDLVAERMVRVRRDPPLSEEARRVVRGYARRLSQLAEERLDLQDREALDVLIEEDSPLGIMRRQDVFLEVSRRIYVARAAGAVS